MPEPGPVNSEIARRGLELWSQGDLDEALSTIDPEIEWHATFRLPDLPADKEVYSGHDEVRVLWNAFRSVWETITIDMEEVLWEGPGVVVVRARFRGKGGTSGIEIDRVLYYVMDIQNLKLSRMRSYDTEAEAMDVAGAPDDS